MTHEEKKEKIEGLEREIRDVAISEPSNIDVVLKEYIEKRLSTLSIEERIEVLEGLVERFKRDKNDQIKDTAMHTDGLTGLVSLFLGEKVSLQSLSQAELSEKLANSLNTVFDKLNHIIGIINAKLQGQKEGQETIRLIISSHIKGGARDDLLHNYLDQIKDAFLISHEAFSTAVYETVKKVISGLDPQELYKTGGGSMEFWPFKEAKLFEIYKDRFKACSEWVESNRFKEDFLREFERACENIYKNK